MQKVLYTLPDVYQQQIAELENMEANCYIKKVDKPTEWVSSMVVAVNKVKVRICIDPKDLNQVIKREHHPTKTIETSLHKYLNAKFSQRLMLNQDSFKLS